MANLLRDPIKSNNQPYNGFPMQQWNYFTCSVGQAIPFYYDLLQPGDKIKVKTDMFTRMQTLLSASPLEITNHVQYFFVPLRYLYSLMPSFLTAVDDIKSSIFDKSDLSLSLPYINVPAYMLEVAANGGDELVTNRQIDMLGDNLHKGIRRVIQGLGYGDFYANIDNYGSDIPQNNILVNPLFACAYQLVYEDYFRIDERQNLDTERFNLDKFYSDADILGTTDADTISNMLQLWYVPWKKDYFTNVDVSPLSSAGSKSILQSETPETFDFVKQWLSTENDVNIVNPDNVTAQNSGSNVQFANNEVGGTQIHRLAAVLERFASIVGSSDKNYRDQIKNLYGFVPPKFTSNMCDRIGYDSMKLAIYEVVSDATTGLPTDSGSSQLGDIAGKSVSYKNGKYHNFIAPEHGIFLAIAFSVPNAVYGVRGLDKVHTYLNRTDFPNPLFDRLGQEPLFMEQLNFTFDTDYNSKSLGWIYRHQEIKQKYDRAFGAFAGSLKYWIPQRTSVGVSQQYDVNNIRPYYVNPWYINPIMNAAYFGAYSPTSSVSPEFYWDDGPNGEFPERNLSGIFLYDTDPIMNFYRVDYVKSSKMDIYGIPKNMM